VEHNVDAGYRSPDGIPVTDIAGNDLNLVKDGRFVKPARST
jgi:hypothetical protein